MRSNGVPLRYDAILAVAKCLASVAVVGCRDEFWTKRSRYAHTTFAAETSALADPPLERVNYGHRCGSPF